VVNPALDELPRPRAPLTPVYVAESAFTVGGPPIDEYVGDEPRDPGLYSSIVNI
jgi:hypothetical protein